MDVVPVQLTIYSLSRLIRKISDLYPSSHFLWHHVPPVPHLVQEYWGFFNAWTLPFPHGKETVSHCDRPWHFLSAQWQHGVNIKHWSVQLPHIFPKFQLVAYQGYFSLIVMYKTVFFSHHADVVSMTETAEKLIQLALVGCGLLHRDLEVSWYILQHPHQLFSDTYDLWHLILHMPIEQRW